jgi:hypothetical protein
MTMVLSYNPRNNASTGFLGFQSSGEEAGLGRHLITMLKNLGSRASNPMLLPALTYSIWIDALNDEHGDIALSLRSVQDQTGLMEDYLHQTRIAEDVVNYDSVHRILVVQHAYLTNGIADFVSSLGPTLFQALERVGDFCSAIPNCRYDGKEVAAFVEHMQVRANTELQHRQRMLDRISMYLQVVSGTLFDSTLLQSMI